MKWIDTCLTYCLYIYFNIITSPKDNKELKSTTAAISNGLILGPILFNAFVSDLSVIKYVRFTTYADDIQNIKQVTT